MKIALCLSGQPRELEEGYSYWKKNLLDHYDVDIFVHSWNSHLNDDIVGLYDPTLRTFEDYKFSPEYDKIYEQNCIHETSLPRYSLSQFYSILQSRNLKNQYEDQNNLKYDWVIRGRFDYALNISFDFNNLDNTLIYVPKRKYIKADNTHEYCFCDLFAFGSSENMNKYMSVYEHIEKYSKIPGYKFYGENLVSTTLIETGLRNHHGYPERKNEKIRYVDMQDPFIGNPESNGRRWIYSLIRHDWNTRTYWLNHDLKFWSAQEKKK
jgi:hypothetical protein